MINNSTYLRTKPQKNEEGFLPSHEFPTDFEPREACIGAMVAAAISGNRISLDNKIEVFTLVNTFDDLQKMNQREIGQMLAKMFVYADQEGYDTLFDQVLGFYVQSYDEIIYTDACRVIHSIKKECLIQSEFLYEFRTGLGISEERAWEIHAEIIGGGDYRAAA